jgi:hypothetical protein
MVAKQKPSGCECVCSKQEGQGGVFKIILTCAILITNGA